MCSGPKVSARHSCGRPLPVVRICVRTPYGVRMQDMGTQADAALTRAARATNEERWGEQDSNLRRHSQRVYSPSPLTTRTSPRATAILESFGGSVRAVDRN